MRSLLSRQSAGVDAIQCRGPVSGLVLSSAGGFTRLSALPPVLRLCSYSLRLQSYTAKMEGFLVRAMVEEPSSIWAQLCHFERVAGHCWSCFVMQGPLGAHLCSCYKMLNGFSARLKLFVLPVRRLVAIQLRDYHH